MFWSKYIIQKNTHTHTHTRLAIIRNNVNFITLHPPPVWKSQILVPFPCLRVGLFVQHGLGEASDRLLTVLMSAVPCVVTWCLSWVISKCCSSSSCGTSVIFGGGIDSLGRDCWALIGPSSTDVGSRDGVDRLQSLELIKQGASFWMKWWFVCWPGCSL